MRFQALACDYDGTIAHHGLVDADTRAALERLVASGRKLILVTGRELGDLERVFPHLELFERIVAENGALLVRPAKHEKRCLAEPPPPAFAETLRARGASPLSVGEVIVATHEPNEIVALEVIRDMGLELHVIFNKGAVMILPSGVNKRTGLGAALDELGLSFHNVAGIGDAENDHAFLEACECSVATANALPTLKDRVDWITTAHHGAGTAELIARILANDLSDLERVRARHRILFGQSERGEVRLDAFGTNILIAGPSGSGKSTAATAIFERLIEQGRQLCLVDPEGDYEHFEGTLCLGTPSRAPGVEEIMQLLAKPDANVVVNLLGLPLEARPPFFAELFPRLLDLRMRTGRPHWIAIDEAHHLLPSSWELASPTVPQRMGEMILVTVHPDHVARAVLSAVDTAIAVGDDPEETLGTLARSLGQPAPRADVRLASGEVLLWRRGEGQALERVRVTPARAERMRHRRKYAQGELGDHSFYFRGPANKLNLRAQNLLIFAQIADGVDDDTWMHHLRAGDYTRWFREKIKDGELAKEAEIAEHDATLSAQESRARIRAAIEHRYSLPA